MVIVSTTRVSMRPLGPQMSIGFDELLFPSSDEHPATRPMFIVTTVSETATGIYLHEGDRSRVASPGWTHRR